MVRIPFTTDQFLSVFERYNRAIEPAPFFAYALGVLALVFACRGGRRSGRAVLAILAAFWATSGAGYHLAFFREINPAAAAFGAAFLLEAALLLGAALRREPPAFALHNTVRSFAALALALYAIVVYPRLGALAGHGYPRSPVFGVAPCPTVIFTIAVLLLAERPGRSLLVIPFLWSLVGLSAAVQLGMTEDYGLAVAAAVAVVFTILEERRERGERHPRASPAAR